ncbi:MAG: hypothetical protein IPH77_14465 [Ignavibacteria bacterium]|nr:hypothetical protein [Ignavibacteria bacterium]
MAVIAELCQRVVVMYGGKIQEIAEVIELLSGPLHPSTRGLLNSIPPCAQAGQKHTFEAIPGIIPHILEFPNGCKFSRCTEKYFDKCDTVEPPLEIPKQAFCKMPFDFSRNIAGVQIHEYQRHFIDQELTGSISNLTAAYFKRKSVKSRPLMT